MPLTGENIASTPLPKSPLMGGNGAVSNTVPSNSGNIECTGTSQDITVPDIPSVEDVWNNSIITTHEQTD